MEKVFNTIVGDAAKVDADEPWRAANAEALDKRTLADWITKQGVSPLCTSALHTMMMADNGVVTEWQSYLANLAMVKGAGWKITGVSWRCIAAGAVTGAARQKNWSAHSGAARVP